MKQEANGPFESKVQPGNAYVAPSKKAKQHNDKNPNKLQTQTSLKGNDSVAIKSRNELSGSVEVNNHHQTTSKKANETKFVNNKLGVEVNKIALNYSLGDHQEDKQKSNTNKSIMVEPQLQLKKEQSLPLRDGKTTKFNQQERASHKTNMRVTNGFSCTSTNPSTGQHLFRQNNPDQKSAPQFIQVKPKLNGQLSAIQQKQLLVLNQKLINSGNGVEQKDIKESSNGFNAQRYENAYPSTQIQNKKRLEKTMNIYNQYCNGKQEMNAYTDLGVFGQKSRINMSNFNKSRNSNMSNKSSNSCEPGQQPNFGQNNPSQQSNYRIGTYYQAKLQQAQSRQNNSYHQSNKNSNSNNTQTSFNIKKQSQSHQDIKMEVRGSNATNFIAQNQASFQNQKAQMNRSNHNKFYNLNFTKQSRNQTYNPSTQNTKQSNTQQNVQMSKHKPSTKGKDKMMQSKTNFMLDPKQMSAVSFNKENEVLKDEKQSTKVQPKKRRHEQKAESLQPQNRNQAKQEMNSTFDNLNMTLTHKFRLSKRGVEKGETNSTISVNHQKLEFRNKNPGSQGKFIPQHSIQPNSKLQRGPKPENYREDVNKLPQIVMQQNKSESSMWNRRDTHLTNDKKNDSKSHKRDESSIGSSKMVKLNKDGTTFSNSKSSLKQNPSEMLEANINILGNFSNANSNNDIQSHYINNKTFATDKRDPHLSLQKTTKGSRVNEKSAEDTEMNRLNSNNSMDYNMSEVNSYSVDRKNKMNYYKKSMEPQPPIHKIESDKQNYNRIQLAPIHGTRENFGVGPGTANTTTYKNPAANIAPSSSLHYKLQSQQCISEVMKHPMGNNLTQQQQQYYNNFYENQNRSQQKLNYQASTFDGSYDYMFNPNNEKLDAMDPKEDMTDIIHMPVIRNQKSQGTYRQNYSKYNNIIVNYQNKDNHSLSEIYDLRSHNIHTETNSVINDGQANYKINQSNNSCSENVDQTLNNQSEAFVQRKGNPTSNDQRPHPFNGPKLHLYKKGQSKSSQMKSRKIKTSEHKHLTDVNSQQNIIYSQVDSNSNYNNYPQRQQLSEGGPNGNQRNHFKPNQKISNTKNGHINISEILRENRQNNGLLQKNVQMKIDGLNHNSRSQQMSQENISHSSFEMGQGTPYDKNNDLQPPILDLDNQSKTNDHHQSSIELDGLHSDVNKQREFSEIMAFETHSAQYPKQMNTLQQKGKDSTSHLGLPAVSNNSATTAFNMNEQRLSSPYIIQQQNLNSTNQVRYSSNMQNTMNIKQDNTDSSMHNSMQTAPQDMSSTRPDTTKKDCNPIYIGQSNEVGSKELTAKSSHKSFLHPKVGKNSKYPPAFKLDTASQNKANTIMINGGTQIMMEGRDSSATEFQTNSNIFAHIINNESQNFSAPNTNLAGKKLEPKQTGDFPTPSEIKEYHKNLKQEELHQSTTEMEDDKSESDFRGSDLQSVAKSHNGECKEFQASQKNSTSIPIKLNDLMNNDKFKSLINEREQRGDALLSAEDSERQSQNQKYCTPQRTEAINVDKNKKLQSTGGVTKTKQGLRSRQGGLGPVGGSRGTGLPHSGTSGKRMSENPSQKRIQQHEPALRFEAAKVSIQESGKASLSKCSEHPQPSQPGPATSQLPLIQQNGSMQAQQSQLHRQASLASTDKPSSRPVKAVPLKKALGNKLSTIEAKPSTYSLANQSGRPPHAFTPRGQESAAQGPVFEISQQLTDQSQQIFEKQANTVSKDEADDSSLNSHKYQASSKAGGKEGHESMRDTNQNAFHSVAQTPCFAETPYGTDQFKGYKITPEQARVTNAMQGIARVKDEIGPGPARFAQADQNPSSIQHTNYPEDHSADPESAYKSKATPSTQRKGKKK